MAQENIEDGPVKFFYPNGQVSSEGLMKNGKPDGYWKTYYTTGVIKSEGKRVNTLLDSTWCFYDQSGNLVQTISYQLGKRNGYSEKFIFDNPERPGIKTLILKELYVNDVKEGKAYSYFKTGELQEESFYRNGKKEGLSREYDRDGNIITLLEYKDNFLISREKINRKDAYGRKQGTYKIFNEENQLILEENYLDDALNGLSKRFDENGKLIQSVLYEKGKIIEEIDEDLKDIVEYKNTFDSDGRLTFSGAYINGLAIGIHRYYNQEGVVINAIVYNDDGIKVSEGIIDDEGNINGPWKDFYPTGEIRARGSYRNNQKSGPWVYYFKNGTTEQKGDYLRDRFEGSWIWYYPDGSVCREENYFNGEEDGNFIEYAPDGKILSSGKYISGEREGEWFYDVGDHIEKGSYIAGLREGKWYYYYSDGTVQFEGNYVQGNPDGKQKYYYPGGELKEEQYYKMGVRTRIWTKYNEEGDPVMTVTYRNNEEYRINGIKVNLPESPVKLIR
ncbi:MAG: toxin-antitoxin system YwqK family antitoxin [Bacteroidota bacterium]